MPTYRLKYLPKNDVLAKLSELEISWIERLGLPHGRTGGDRQAGRYGRWIFEILSFSAYHATFRV